MGAQMLTTQGDARDQPVQLHQRQRPPGYKSCAAHRALRGSPAAPFHSEGCLSKGEVLMSRGLSVLCTAGMLALLSATPALAAPASTSVITATGTGQVRVRPADRHSNASIAAAYQAARKASIGAAFTDARQLALDYARHAGLTLGRMLSVSDQQTGGGFYGPGPVFFGPFAPGQFCGTVRQPIFKHVKHGEKVTGFKKVYRCFVPPFAFTSLALTYTAS